MVDFVFLYEIVGNGVYFIDFEGFVNFNLSSNFFFFGWFKYVFDSSMDFFDCFVDNGVGIDFYIFLFC